MIVEDPAMGWYVAVLRQVAGRRLARSPCAEKLGSGCFFLVFPYDRAEYA
jgi:hypothetical protein